MDVRFISIMYGICTPGLDLHLPAPRTGREVITQSYHVSQLVGYDGDHPLLVPGGGGQGVVQQGRLPVGDQPPVLHGPRVEVWQGYLVWVVEGRAAEEKEY